MEIIDLTKVRNTFNYILDDMLPSEQLNDLLQEAFEANDLPLEPTYDREIGIIKVYLKES